MTSNIKKHWKLVLLSLAFVISVIPIFVLAKYDCASGDDYNYGALAHQAFLSTGSVWSAVVAAVKTTIETWYSLQGTWFDCFVFCLHPEVFSDKFYPIVPYIFVVVQFAAFSLLGYHFLKERWKLQGYSWLEITLVFLLFMFQLVPSQKSAFFWWVGSVHYAMPMCLSIVGIVLADRFLNDHHMKDVIVLSIVSACIGGATYPAAILLFVVIIVLWLVEVVIKKNNDSRNFFLLIPCALEFAGLFISFIAPGNAVRSASDISDGAKPSGGVVSTIVSSIRYSFTDAWDSFISEKTFILIAILMIIILIKTPLIESKEKDEKTFAKRFEHPLLFVVTALLINAAIYTPRMYAGNMVSSGYFNFNFEVFFLCIVGCVIYIEGWVISKNIVLDSVKRRVLVIATIIAAIIIAFVGRHGVKKYTDYVCLEYFLSGHADDYLEQIDLQRCLMEDDAVQEVIVPQINNEQGPLMHMPIVSDPDNINNIMTARFYGKKSCKSISREEWMQKYR